MAYDSYGTWVPDYPGQPVPGSEEAKEGPGIDPYAGPAPAAPESSGPFDISAAISTLVGGSNGTATIIGGIPDAYIFGYFWKEKFQEGNGSGLSHAERVKWVQDHKDDPRFAAEVRQRFDALPPRYQQDYIDGMTKGIKYDPILEPDLYAGAVKDTARTESEGRTQGLLDEYDERLSGLEGLAQQALAGDEEAYKKLQAELARLDMPALPEYIGDYVSQAASAAADPRDIEAQYRDLAKYEKLSDPSITAEEKLMMEMSRQTAEDELKGQRGALQNNLQARGRYGSGSELTLNANAQQEAAKRHAIELLGAQSNAQKRAMESLGKHAELSTKMRESSFSEDESRKTAADRATELMRTLKDDFNRWKHEQAVAAVSSGRTTAFDTFNTRSGLNWKPYETTKETTALHDPAKPGGKLDLEEQKLEGDIAFADDTANPRLRALGESKVLEA